MGSSSSTSLGATNENLTPSGSIYINRYPVFRFCSYARVLFGCLTSVVVFWAAFDSLVTVSAIPIGMYMLFIGTPIFLLEFGRVIRMCCGTDGACCRVFSIVLGFDRWKRGLMYCLVSVPLFMPDVSNTSAKIAGCLLFITGALYSAKTCQKKKVKMYVLNSPSAGGMQQNNPITYNTTSTTSPA